MRGLSLVAASGGHSSSRCAGLSLLRPLLLRSTGSRRAGSVAVAHGLSCSAACGIFPGQGSNPCPLHWQADSQPLRHQGSPQNYFYNITKILFAFFPLLTFTLILQKQRWVKMLATSHQPVLVVTGFFFFFFGRAHEACRILVPQPGIEPGPRPTAVKAPSPNHWTTREFPVFFIIMQSQQKQKTNKTKKARWGRSQGGALGGRRIRVFSRLGHLPGTGGRTQTPKGTGGTPSNQVGSGAWGE